MVNYHFSSKDELWRAAVDGLFAELGEALDGRAAGLRGVDALTTGKLLIREFIGFSATHPQLHRIITQECKNDGPRMDWMVERHIRPRYEQTTALFRQLVEAGHVPDIPVEHLYYILTGAGPTMFVLGPGVPPPLRCRPPGPRGRRGPCRRRAVPALRRRPEGTVMHHPLQLAYLGLEVPDPSTLSAFFADVVGLVPGEGAPAGALAWRNDDKAQRVIVETGPANDAEFIGFDAGDDGALDALVARLDTAGFAARGGHR